MDHRFGTTWTTHLPDDDGGLERKGHMDLSTMLANGRLDNGRFLLPGGGVRRLEGQVVGNSITLREFDGVTLRATYDGMLAHENADGSRMVIVGQRRPVTTPGIIDEDVAATQQDSPWVITKP